MNDVVVVGASACGALAAKSAVVNGANTLLLEEDASPGKFHKCSGLYSKKGLQSLGINFKPFIVNEIKGANIHAGNHVFTVSKRDTIALVLNRQQLDEALCRDAVTAGAKLELGQRITRRTTANGVASGKAEFSFRYLIGADGVASSVAYLYNFPPIGHGNIAMCYEAEYDNCNLIEKDKVDVFLDSKLFPGFFGWIIPSGGKKARIGFGTTKHAAVKNAFEKFFQIPLVKKLIGDEKLRDFWHPIPLRVRKKTEIENVLLVGDAAGQTKSTSVDYNEPILLNKRGLIRTEYIGSFVNDLLAKPGLVFAANSPLGYVETIVADSISSAAVNKDFKTTSSPVIRVFKHAISEKLFNIVLKNGFRVKTTGSHSVMCFENYAMVQKKVSELKPGDNLLVSFNVPNKENVEQINLIEFIVQEAPHLVKNIRVIGGRHLLYKKSTEIDPRFRSAYWGRNSIPLSKFLEKNVTPVEVKITFEPRGKYVEINNVLKIDSQFARLLGYVVAEGSIRESDTTLVFGLNDIKTGLVKDAVNCIRSVFGVVPQEPKLKLNQKTGKSSAISISFGGKLLSAIFKDVFKCGSGAKFKQVPFIIFNVRNENKLEFLKGYLRGDGTSRIRTPLNRRNWSAEISGKTASYKLVSDLVLLSIQLGLTPTVQKGKVRAHIWNNSTVKGGESYKICFSGKVNLSKLLDVFPDKKDQLKNFLENVTSRTILGLPKKYFSSEFIHDLFLKYGGKNVRKNYHSYNSYSYADMKKILSNIKIGDFRIDILRTLVEEKLYIIPIKVINRVAPSTGEVFDIEVEDTHTFLGGLGPIVLHNTGGGVIFGGQCAQIAGEIAARNCNGENLSYERQWKEKFGRVLKSHRVVRKVFDAAPYSLHKLTVLGFDKLFINKLLEKFGDMDYV